jgi:hypothetical protein
MTRSSLAVVITFGAFLVTLGTVRAAEPLKPLRTIVFNVDYSVRIVRREQTSGFGGDPTGGTTSVTQGHGEVENALSNDENGTLTVAIVAATPDGGLVADVSFAGKATSQTPIRVAIFADGQLSYNPTSRLSPEAAGVLPFLARGLLTDHQIAAGESWNVAASAPATGSATYRVQSVDGSRAVIGIESSVELRGPQGFDEHTQGSTTYATDVLSPLKLDLTSVARHQIPPDQSDTTTTHITATQVSDSFQHH